MNEIYISEIQMKKKLCIIWIEKYNNISNHVIKEIKKLNYNNCLSLYQEDKRAEKEMKFKLDKIVEKQNKNLKYIANFILCFFFFCSNHYDLTTYLFVLILSLTFNNIYVCIIINILVFFLIEINFL